MRGAAFCLRAWVRSQGAALPGLCLLPCLLPSAEHGETPAVLAASCRARPPLAAAFGAPELPRPHDPEGRF